MLDGPAGIHRGRIDPEVDSCGCVREPVDDTCPRPEGHQIDKHYAARVVRSGVPWSFRCCTIGPDTMKLKGSHHAHDTTLSRGVVLVA